MTLKQLKQLLYTLNSAYNLTLNTDWSEDSKRDREAIMEARVVGEKGKPKDDEVFEFVVDTYLELRKIIDELEKSDRAFEHIEVDIRDKGEPLLY